MVLNALRPLLFGFTNDPPKARVTNPAVKPCPFCGKGEPEVVHSGEDGYHVACFACGAHGPTQGDDWPDEMNNEEDAILLWNMRQP